MYWNGLIPKIINKIPIQKLLHVTYLVNLENLIFRKCHQIRSVDGVFSP